jgi:hypothetical protein
MVERVAMLVRTAAREGKFKISEDMLSLAGATRGAMGLMLLDLGYKVVGEEVVEDPTKPPIQIFEKQRKSKVLSNKPEALLSNKSSRGRKETSKNTLQREHVAGDKSRSEANLSSRLGGGQPNPNSPFAVLAVLKHKG